MPTRSGVRLSDELASRRTMSLAVECPDGVFHDYPHRY